MYGCGQGGLTRISQESHTGQSRGPHTFFQPNSESQNPSLLPDILVLLVFPLYSRNGFIFRLFFNIKRIYHAIGSWELGSKGRS